MKVLMSAYACEPGEGSEPAVGWNWALQAARQHEVWVITRRNNRATIEAALAAEPQPNLHFVYHDLPRKLAFWKRGGRGVHLYYLLWQLSALSLARRLHKQIRFDIGHHVTFVSYRFPSFLAWIDLPYVWGPVAGAESAPKSFYKTFGRRGLLVQRLRDLSNALVKLDPLVRRTARRARMIIAATPDTAMKIKHQFSREALISPAIGWSGRTGEPQRAEGPLKAVYVGRLLYWKGVHLALEAFAQASALRPEMMFTIVGDGPKRPRLEAQARELGVESRVRFTGRVPAEAVSSLLSEHNSFIFPSFQDSGAFAVLEAMAAGLPVIAVESGGPALLVTDETGILIPPHDPAQTITGLCDALIRLNDYPELRQGLGAAGAQRASEEFIWDRLDNLLQEIYADCLKTRTASERQTVLAGALDG
jgi:glycosyltransferase involved in cell wall biosynthesis